MGIVKQLLFSAAVGKYDRMVSKHGQKYYFIFVHEDGNGLEEISRIFEDRKIEASVDEVFNLDSVHDALKKIAKGGSRGKTVLRIS